MSDPSDDAIEALLRKQFDGPVSDAGFSDRVMQGLPPARRRTTWPLWTGVLAGVVACWLGLLHAPILNVGWSDWLRADWSVSAITVALVVVGLSLMALLWSVGEADNG